MTLYNIICVAIGSGLGGVMRYLLSSLIKNHTSGAFPWATLVVNIVGCFVIGLIYALADRHKIVDQHLLLTLTVGLCGGFTTFSTFTNENITLLQSGHHWLFAAYTAAGITAGIIAIIAARALV